MLHETQVRLVPNYLFGALTPAEQDLVNLVLDTGIVSNIKLAALRKVSRYTIANQTTDAFDRVERECGRRPYTKLELLGMVFEQQQLE